MNSALLVIALLNSSSITVDAVYPMENIVECEAIASHKAVAESYPDRLVFCWDGTSPFPARNLQQHTGNRGSAAKQPLTLQPYMVPPAR